MPSDHCHGTEYWDSSQHTCVPCANRFENKAGHEFNTNCGLNDEGDHMESMYKPCSKDTFNDGSSSECKPCSACVVSVSSCTAKSDTVCCNQGQQVSKGQCITPKYQPKYITTQSSLKPDNPSTARLITVSVSTSSPNGHLSFTGICICLGILFTLILVCLFLLLRRRTNPFRSGLKHCSETLQESFSKKADVQSTSYIIFEETPKNDPMTSLELPLDIQNAPLKKVLDNLDVLEELVLVLDPDVSGVKNTRHLAAQFSFSFAWINYAYSMKDHKSPLVAVLEGVVTKNPELTIGYLFGLLNGIGRNDAVEILAKWGSHNHVIQSI